MKSDLISCLAVFGGLVGIFAAFAMPGLDAFRQPSGMTGSFSAAEQGRIIFVARCAQCHGYLAEGTERGPLLIAPGPGEAPVSRFRKRVHERPERGERLSGISAFSALSDRSVERIIAFLRRLERPGETP